MSLIARGRGLRGMATEGFAKSAELEARENQTFQQIEAAQDAQETQTLGAGAGIGALYGLKAGAATGAAAGGAAAGGAASAFAPFGVAQAGATGGAVAGSGMLAGAAALAAPIAIGLGVAFLINKLFD